jgi:hypothetical protein
VMAKTILGLLAAAMLGGAVNALAQLDEPVERHRGDVCRLFRRSEGGQWCATERLELQVPQEIVHFNQGDCFKDGTIFGSENLEAELAGRCR